MKKFNIFLRFLFSICFVLLLSICSFAIDYKYNTEKIEEKKFEDIELFPGGMPFGIKMNFKGLSIVKFASDSSPACKAGMKVGDIITKINNQDVNSIEEFTRLINKNGNSEIDITVIRNDKEYVFKVVPELCSDDGLYKTGVWVKDSASGIGTVTFIDPDTNLFGGLGHGICDSASGKIIPISRGTVLDVNINGVIKGRIGTAGELKGAFNAKKLGTLIKNSNQGVFGFLSNECFQSPEGKLKLCPKNEVKEGDAYIWCTLGDEKPQKYSVKLSSIDVNNTGVKNFRIKITDKKLLERSGGIVQGMSGSPIIQNGKLVGAVTHVLINDPTTGYGIFIENMLESMPNL
jgi:stage IV sporulation protein B